MLVVVSGNSKVLENDKIMISFELEEKKLTQMITHSNDKRSAETVKIHSYD